MCVCVSVWECVCVSYVSVDVWVYVCILVSLGVCVYLCVCQAGCVSLVYLCKWCEEERCWVQCSQGIHMCVQGQFVLWPMGLTGWWGLFLRTR